MKKLLLILMALFLWAGSSWAQNAGGYTGTASLGGTLVDMSTGTTNLLTIAYHDDDPSALTNIGFTFNFCTTNYTQFSINSNGQLRLGSTVISGTAASPASGVPLILPISGDNAVLATGKVHYKVINSTPNQILVVEWSGIRIPYGSTGTGGTCQVLLYETSGKIEFIYGVMYNNATSATSRGLGISNGTTSGQIGQWVTITATPTYNTTGTSITTTSFTASSAMTNLNGTVPGALRKFTFDPPVVGTPLPPTNPSPANAATGVAISGNLTWTFGTNTVTYDLWYGVTGSMTKVVTGGTAGATGSYAYSANYSTTYQWQVIEYNGALTTNGPVWSFTTICGPAAIPWTESFEGVTIPTFPLCWYKENGDWATTNNVNATYDADARTGTQFLRESYSATNEYIWTPGFALTIGTSYDFSFWWAGDTYSGWTGDVFYNTTQSSTGATQLGTSFVTNGTTTTKTYAQFLNSFVAPSTTTYYFAIRVNCPTSTPWYLSFDDFKMELSPLCTAPSAQTVTNKTDIGADLGWTSIESFFDVYFDLGGGTPGPSTTPTIDNTSNNPNSWSGGVSATTYSWWVRSDCDPGNNNTNVSAWTGPNTFTTLLCAPIDQCNYTFRMTDSYGDTWNGNTMAVIQGGVTVQTLSHTTSGTAPVDVLVGLCDGLGFELYWNSGGSYPLEVGIEILDAFGTSLYYKAPGTGTQGTTLYTGIVNCTPPEFVDWCNLQWPGSGTPNEGNYDVYAQVWEPGVTNAPGQGAGINAWIGYSTSNTNPNTWTNWIPANYNAFGGGADNDEYMLNLGLVIGNNPGIYYYASRFELNSAGAYKYGGFSGTGGGFWDGTSNISGVLTINCPIYAIPYHQNFDEVTAPAMPSCFTVENVNADVYYWQTNSTYRLSAPNSAYIRYNTALAMDDWMFLPGLQMTGGKTYEISFAYGASTSFPESLAIYWGDSPSSSAMINGPIFDETFTGGYYLGLGSFTPASDGVYYIGFWGHSDMDEFWLSVDDILVTEAVPNVTWNGLVNNNWHNAGNWNEAVIPASTSNVTIPAGLTNYPTITSAAACNNISIGSNAVNTATLLDNGLLIVFGSGSVQRYFTGDPTASQDWHLVSSPVAGATASVFMDMYLQSFAEATNSYTEISDPITPLNLMEGYGLYSTLSTNNSITFTGDFILGSQSKTFTYLDQVGINGNPFVSGL